MPQLIECRADGCVALRAIDDAPAFQKLADFMQADPMRLGSRQAQVLLEPQDDPFALRPCFDRIALIAVHFPTFTDGRGFSNARILRRELGWQGPLRATGRCLPDQWLALIRVGFDQIEVEPTSEHLLRRMLGRMSASYQSHYPMPDFRFIQAEASRDLR